MAKHFHISITDDAFSFTQNHLSIAAEAALDGIYVVRTNLPAAYSDAAATVRAYKSLSNVEHAFRSLKMRARTSRRGWLTGKYRARRLVPLAHEGRRTGTLNQSRMKEMDHPTTVRNIYANHRAAENELISDNLQLHRQCSRRHQQDHDQGASSSDQRQRVTAEDHPKPPLVVPRSSKFAEM
jgi:hypothetical protein